MMKIAIFTFYVSILISDSGIRYLFMQLKSQGCQIIVIADWVNQFDQGCGSLNLTNENSRIVSEEVKSFQEVTKFRNSIT